MSSSREAFKEAQTNPFTPSTDPIRPSASPVMTDYVHYLTAIFSGDMSYFEKGAKASLEQEDDTVPELTEEATEETPISGIPKRIVPDPNNKEVAAMVNLLKSSKLDSDDQQYLYKLGLRESGLDPNAPAQGSHRGLYQFNDSTLNTIGVSPKQYDSSPVIQFNAALQLKKHNLNILKDYLQEYENKKVRGITITANGLAAAAHLAGAGNVIKWFKGGNFQDALGTSIDEYLQLFT